MAKYSGPVCRLCRREDMKLFLKGDRCYTDKCGYERRAYAPGQHGQARRRKQSNYGSQLREKQKVKRMYGILERQFRNYFTKASRKKGITGANLLQFLERRLDNIVYRLGFASSRKAARQLIGHGHVEVNGKRVDIPSFRVRKGDKIDLTTRGQKAARIEGALGALETRSMPSWLSIDKDLKQGTILGDPVRDEITLPIQEQLIIELYSR